MAHLPLTLLYRQSFIEDSLKASADTKLKMIEACTGDISKAIDAVIKAFNNKRKVLLCGNGGSAADSQHMAAELVGRFRREKRPLPAIALTANSSTITAISTDSGVVGDFITNDTTLTVSGTNAALGAGERIQVSSDGGATWQEIKPLLAP